VVPVPGFDAEVRASGRGSHAVVVPKAVVGALGSRRVVARIGEESFETTLGAYGGRTFLGLRKALLTTLGVAAGDTVHVELEPAAPVEEPEAEPEPTTCPELEQTLASDEALATAWRSLPEGHRAEYGRWTSTAETAGDREARIARLRHRLLG
jgi:hypothetical protein